MYIIIGDSFCEYKYNLEHGESRCIAEVAEAIGKAFPDCCIDAGVLITPYEAKKTIEQEIVERYVDRLGYKIGSSEYNDVIQAIEEYKEHME